MSSGFTRAAVERIAQCAGAGARNAAPAAQAVRDDYRSSTTHFVGAFLSELDPEAWLFGEPVGLRLYLFAELLELAVVAGYVDLGEMDERLLLGEALERFCAEERIEPDANDLTLVLDLLSRLRGLAPMRVAQRDDKAFHAFAAYLCLVDQVRQDSDFHRFVAHSGESWQAGDDLGFLVSPRHFAEALVKGRIGNLEARDAAGGLRAMDYLVALQDFVQRTAHAGELPDKALRHARWSHRIDVIERRLGLWQERMAEWPGAESELEPGTYFATLTPLRQRLRDLALTPPAAPVNGLVTPTAEQLLALGRPGAAIKSLQGSLRYLGHELSDRSSARWEAKLVAYLEAALQLAELGQVDEAAAWLARFEPELADPPNRLSPGDVRRAFAVLGEARRALPATTEGDASPQRQVQPGAPPAQATGFSLREGKSQDI